jgi:RND family efflux transporter MFP subunit
MVACLLVATACSRRTQEKASLPAAGSAAPPAVRVATASERLDVGIARVSGAIRSKNEATLSAKFTGQLVKLDVSVGDHVKRGQALGYLDSTNARIALENANAAERVASANFAGTKTEFERTKSLAQSGSVPGAQLDRSQTAFDLAGAQLEQARVAIHSAQQQITDATLIAPFDGVVTGKFKNTGDTVAMMPPTALLTLSDPGSLEVRFAVPEPLAAFAHAGDTVRGSVSPSGLPFEATVRVVGSVVDLATRTVEVIADLTNPKDGSVRSGALVNVDLGKAESLVGPFIPTAAIRIDGAQRYVLVVAGDKLVRRDVEGVPINAGIAQVKRGLVAGDRVVVDPGATDLRAGDTVAVLVD